MTERSFEPDPPALDPAAIEGFASRELFVIAASAFLEVTPQLLSTLAAAVRDDDRPQVVELARRLRISCAPMGAHALAERCADLEVGPPHAAASLSLAVSVEYRRVATALKGLLG